MKKYKRLISMFLLMSFILLPVNQIMASGERGEPLAIIDGEEFYGSLRLKESKAEKVEKIKEDWANMVIRRFGLGKGDKEALREKLEKHLEKEYRNFVDNEILTNQWEEENIEKGLLTEEETRTLPDKEYWDKVRQISEDPEKWRDSIDLESEEVKEFLKDKKLERKEISYDYSGFKDLEEANSYYEKLNSKEYREAIEKYKVDYNQEKTLLDRYNNQIKENELWEAKNSIIGFEENPIESGGGSYYLWGENTEDYYYDPLKEIISNIEEVGIPTKPMKYDGLGECYYIFIINKIESSPISDDDIKWDYLSDKSRKENKEKLEKLEIEYLYPKLELKEDFFDNEALVASVNGKDVFIEKRNYNIGSGEESQKEIDYFTKIAIKEKLREEDMVKKGFKLLEDKEDSEYWEEYSKYYDSLREEINIRDEDVDKFIKENRGKLIQYNYSTFNFLGENKEEIYEKLKENNNVYKITKIFSSIGEFKDVQLTEEEKVLLESFELEDFYCNYNMRMDGMSWEDKYNPDPWRGDSRKDDYYREIKKLKEKEISQLKNYEEYSENYYEALFLYKIDNSEETIESFARMYLENEKINDYYEKLFKEADIKYYDIK